MPILSIAFPTEVALPAFQTVAAIASHIARLLLGLSMLAALLVALVNIVRRSRSLASMLPSLLLSGVTTLVNTAVMQLMWSSGITEGFAGRWMESWLIAWPIAFPLAYLLGPSLLKLAAVVSAPATAKTV